MRRFLYGVLVGIVLGGVFTYYGERIIGAYSGVAQIQLRLDDTNNTLTALEKRKRWSTALAAQRRRSLQRAASRDTIPD